MLMLQFEKGALSHSEYPQKTTAFYESLLKIAATNPEKLNDIQELVPKLDTGIVPDSFKQMCSTFQKTIKKLR